MTATTKGGSAGGNSKESSFKDAKMLASRPRSQSEKIRLIALAVCIASVVFNAILAVAAFVCAAVTDSTSGYAFALDSLLDAAAAGLVVWRFYGSGSELSHVKERVACVCLGILLCVASVAIIVKSAYDLVSQHMPQKLVYVFVLAGAGGVTSSILGAVKYVLGRKMNSQCLILEAINTLLSAFLAVMLAVSDGLYFYHPSAWTIDPITSIVVAFILFVCGIRVLTHKTADDCEESPLLSSSKA